MTMRKGTCGTRYLCIAVIRPLEVVIHDLFSVVCRPVVDGVYIKETKGEARRLLERLFNQNEQALGLFYLHEETEAGIAIPSVALLRVAVTLKVEHYDIVQSARSGRLCSEFRSKLGWLVGNTYSRIGTPDWTDPPERSDQLKKLIRQWVDHQEDPLAPMWVPEAWVRAAKDSGVSLKDLSKGKLETVLQAYKPIPAKQRIIEQAVRVFGELCDLDNETAKKIRNRLENDSRFSKAMRDAKQE
ncbi:MAG: hypothetical protein K8S55_13495 [Phycisphaerae bacterium]|nr:hypothetical protein [Phycisphaerae bacterium]